MEDSEKILEQYNEDKLNLNDKELKNKYDEISFTYVLMGGYYNMGKHFEKDPNDLENNQLLIIEKDHKKAATII